MSSNGIGRFISILCANIKMKLKPWNIYYLLSIIQILNPITEMFPKIFRIKSQNEHCFLFNVKLFCIFIENINNILQCPYDIQCIFVACTLVLGSIHRSSSVVLRISHQVPEKNGVFTFSKIFCSVCVRRYLYLFEWQLRLPDRQLLKFG